MGLVSLKLEWLGVVVWLEWGEFCVLMVEDWVPDSLVGLLGVLVGVGGESRRCRCVLIWDQSMGI